MNVEVQALNRFLKRMYPFVIEVTDITSKSVRIHSLGVSQSRLKISVYVSPIHFCELMDDRVNTKLNKRMSNDCQSLLKSIIPNWDGNHVQFIFFPDIDTVTIFDGLD